MKAAPIANWFWRLPMRALRGIRSLTRKVLLSVRFWVLVLLLIIVGIAAYYVLSNRSTPFTSDAYVQAYVVQIAPRVEGEVVHVYVRDNQAVKKGDPLFEIDPRPFHYRVALLEAKLAEAVQQINQMETDLAHAKAMDERLKAEEIYAQAVHDQESEIFKQDATTTRKYLDAVQKYKSAQASKRAGQAHVQKAEAALAAKIGEEHALVAEVRAQLAEARLNLEWTRVYAPADGYVTDLQLREGFYVHIGSPVLTCIENDPIWIVANLRENCLENIRPGQRVGIAFNNYPGRIFPGVVESIGWGVVEGQGAPSGALPAVKEPANWIRLAQRFQVRIIPKMPEDAPPLRIGATCCVAVYTRDHYWLNPVTETWQDFVAAFDHLR